jgi:uncharacterized protein (TIGR02118 family)
MTCYRENSREGKIELRSDGYAVPFRDGDSHSPLSEVSGITLRHELLSGETHSARKGEVSRVGLEGVSLTRGTGTLDGTVPPFEVIGHLAFASAQQMQGALAAHGPEIIGDIPNFTNVQPLIQIDEPL